MTVLDPGLAALAHEAGLVWQVEPDHRLLVGESEVQLFVLQEGEDLVVERVSRGAPAGTQLRTRERAAIERYLVAWIGDAWRESRHMPRALVDASTTARDAAVVQGENWDATLTWTQDGRTCTATHLNVGAARRLAALLAHDLDTLVASYREPAGRPALATA
ncbi:hypothetical protein [Cellulomonas sp. SLBN-39]|uniref:hypothetical protein n=1 Tax=Cellulomonas sp. SLBN-39 TaxID=2768446 RepID=UPI00114F7906|nr:hypothetical protein [Cellulomonas sp. SLBN-39]TQL02659.1 hypothetical protein FBY24_1739 [Cellulomonas sp. SLBN-39]